MKKVITFCIFQFICCVLNYSVSKAQTDAVINKPTGEMVITPAGLVEKSKVHFVDGKHHLNITDGSVQVIDTKTGTVSSEFDNNGVSGNNNKSISNINSRISAADTDNGWVTDAKWHNMGIKPITYFNTDWVVPNPPVTSSYQTIFLFNAVVDTLHGSTGTYYILQPVLQWGQSSAGGGSYWSITNWCVCLTDWNVTGLYYGSLITVNPGTSLQGVIKLTSDSGSAFNYNSAFTEYPDSALQVNNLNRADWAYETLEVYNLIGCDEYPSDTVIKMTDIRIETDSVYPSLSWIAQNIVNEYGQYTNIVSDSSNGGEVDIYFHTSCVSAGIANEATTSSEINVYPNPSTGKFQIESSMSQIQRIDVYNMIGELVYTVPFTDNRSMITVNIADLPNGMYVVQLRTKNGVEIKKFIKG